MKKPLFVVLFFIFNLLNGVLGTTPEVSSQLEDIIQVSAPYQKPSKKKIPLTKKILTFIKEKPKPIIGSSIAVASGVTMAKNFNNNDDGIQSNEVDSLTSVIKSKEEKSPTIKEPTAKAKEETTEKKIKTIKKPNKNPTNNGSYIQGSNSYQDQSYVTVHSEKTPKTVPLIPKNKKQQNNYQNNIVYPSVVEMAREYEPDNDNPLKNHSTASDSGIPRQNRSEPLKNNYSFDGQPYPVVEKRKINKSLKIQEETLNNPFNTYELPTIQEESMVADSILWNQQIFNDQQKPANIIHIDSEELIISQYDHKYILLEQLRSFRPVKKWLKKYPNNNMILEKLIQEDDHYHLLKKVWDNDDLKKFLYEPAVLSLLQTQLIAYSTNHSILKLDAGYLMEKLGMFECLRIMSTPIAQYEKYHGKSHRKNLDEKPNNGQDKADQLIQDNHPSVSTSRLDKNSISNIVDNFSNNISNNFEDNTSFIREVVGINNGNGHQLIENNQQLPVELGANQEENDDENISQTINYGQGKNQHLIKLDAKNQTLINQTLMNQTLLITAQNKLENSRANDDGNISQTINYGQFNHKNNMAFEMENKIDESEHGQTVIVHHMDGAIKEEELMDNFNLTKVANDLIDPKLTEKIVIVPENPVLLVEAKGEVDGSNFVINPLASIDQLESQLNLSLTHDQSLAHQKLLENHCQLPKESPVNLNNNIVNNGINSEVVDNLNNFEIKIIDSHGLQVDSSQFDLQQKPIEALEQSINGDLSINHQPTISFNGFKNNYENLPPVSMDGILMEYRDSKEIVGGIMDQLINQVAMAVNDGIKGQSINQLQLTHQTIEEPHNETPTISDSSIPQEDEPIEQSSKIQIAVNGISFKDKIIQYKGDKLDPLMEKIHKNIIHKFKMIIETHKQENCQDTIIIENKKLQWSEPYYDLIKMLEYNIHKVKDPYAINKFSTIMVNLYLLLENNVQKNLKNFYSYTYEKHGVNSHERLLTYKSKFIEFFNGNWDLLKKEYNYSPNFNGEYMPFLSYLFSTLLIYGHQWNSDKTIIVQLIEKQSISEIFINQVKDLKIIELSWHKLWVNGENLSTERIAMAFPDGFSRLLRAFVKNCLNLQNIDKELNQWFQSVTTFIKDNKIISNNYLLTISNKDFSITLSLILEYLNHQNNSLKTTVAISKRSVPQLQIAHLKDTLDTQYHFKGTTQPLSLYQKFSTPRFNHKKTLSSSKPSVENNTLVGDFFNTIKTLMNGNNNQRNGSEIRPVQTFRPMLKGLELEDENPKTIQKKADLIKKQINKKLQIDSSSSDTSPKKIIEKKITAVVPVVNNGFNDISRIYTLPNNQTQIIGLTQFDDDYSQEQSN